MCVRESICGCLTFVFVKEKVIQMCELYLRAFGWNQGFLFLNLHQVLFLKHLADEYLMTV